MQVRICEKCGAKNPISAFECNTCGADISMQPYVEEKGTVQSRETQAEKSDQRRKFIKCPACGYLNEIIPGAKRLRCCKKCRNEIKTLGDDAIVYEGEEDKQTDAAAEREPAPRKKDTIKSIVLTNERDGKEVRVYHGKHILGAYGDYEQDYFWDLKYVGNKHLEIEVSDEKVYVIDDSRNHTYINKGVALPRKERMELMDGDLLTMADQDFRVKFCR